MSSTNTSFLFLLTCGVSNDELNTICMKTKGDVWVVQLIEMRYDGDSMERPIEQPSVEAPHPDTSNAQIEELSVSLTPPVPERKGVNEQSIVIIVIIVVLLLIGGIAAFFFLSRPQVQTQSLVTPAPSFTPAPRRPGTEDLFAPPPKRQATQSAKPLSTAQPKVQSATPSTAQTVPATPSTAQTVPATPSAQLQSVTLNKPSGQGGFVTNAGFVSAQGDISVGRNGENLYRGFLGFDLSAVPKGVTVQKATLRVYQRMMYGSPYTKLGQLDIDHLDYGTTLTADSYAGGTLYAASFASVTAPNQGEWKTVDVTAQVKRDLLSHQSSQFRLHFHTEAKTTVGLQDMIVLSGSLSGNEQPQLIIEYN